MRLKSISYVVIVLGVLLVLFFPSLYVSVENDSGSGGGDATDLLATAPAVYCTPIIVEVCNPTATITFTPSPTLTATIPAGGNSTPTPALTPTKLTPVVDPSITPISARCTAVPEAVSIIGAIYYYTDPTNTGLRQNVRLDPRIPAGNYYLNVVETLEKNREVIVYWRVIRAGVRWAGLNLECTRWVSTALGVCVSCDD